MDEVRVRLDRERVLRFSGMALALLERTTNLSIMSIMRRFAENDVPFSVILAMLYAGLQHEIPGTPEEHVLRLIEQNVPGKTVFEKVMSLAPQAIKAFADALPAAEKNAEAPEESPGNAGIGRSTNS